MTISITQSFNLTTASPNDTQYSYASANPVATPLITDANGNTYGIDPGAGNAGFVVINGVDDSSTSGAVQIVYVQGLIWYAKVVSSALQWASRSGPTGAWSAGSTTSPFVAEQRMTNLLISPTPVLLGQPFTITGTLVSYYFNNPFGFSLNYGDDGATPSKSVVVQNNNGTFSIVHPAGLQPGAHSVTVVDPAQPLSTATANLYIPIQGGTVTGLTATASGGTVSLHWSAVAGASSYGFMTSIDNSTWIVSDQTTTALSVSMAGPTMSTSFAQSVGYYFEVFPVNSNGTTGGPAISPLLVPNPIPQVTGLTGSSSNAGTVNLSWTNIPNVNYVVQTATDQVTWITHDTTYLSPNASVFNITSTSQFVLGTNYYFRVYAIPINATYATTSGGPVSAVLGPLVPYPLYGTVQGLTQIFGSAPTAHAINILIMADGYTAAQQTNFNSAATTVANAFTSTAPYSTNSAKMNIYRLNVASNQSGLTNDAGNGVTVQTFFQSMFFGDRGVLANSNITLTTAAKYLPQFSCACVIANSTTYAGLGGPYISMTANSSAAEMACHEMGHTIFDLSDEYGFVGGTESVSGGGTMYTGSEPLSPHGNTSVNSTININRSTIKWASLIQSSTPLPTLANSSCSTGIAFNSGFSAVGAYEGAQYYNCGIYRPQNNCKMQQLGVAFCAVCTQKINAVFTAA